MVHTAIGVGRLVQHDIAIVGLNGATKTDFNETHGYTLFLRNNAAVEEVVPFRIAVIPLTGCQRPGIDVDGDGLDDSIAVDVNGDGRLDSLAFSVSEEPLAPGKRGSAEFDVQYTTCPQPFVGSGEDTTPIDYEVSVDACHRGDPAPLGFGGGSCPDLGFPSDGGIDVNVANDGPVTLEVNNTSFFQPKPDID